MAINVTPEQNDYTNLTPFKTWLVNQINTWGVNNFPFLEGDFDKLTNYGMLMKMMKCLNDIISNQNLVEDDMSKLYEAFTELQNYINTYFNNLDVQEEINNKIDAMVLSGEFQQIVEPVLNELINPISNRVETIENDVEVLTGRVDNLSHLPDGSTAGDAELTDIRIGGNGITYSSAGNAVRGQFTELHNTNKHFDMYEIDLEWTAGFIKPSDLTIGTGGDHFYSNCFLLPAMSILHVPRITRSNGVCSICECDAGGNPTNCIWIGCGISESDGSYCYFITTEDIYIRVAGNHNDAVKDFNHYYISKFNEDIVIDENNFKDYRSQSAGDVYGDGGLSSNSVSRAGYIHTTNIYLPKGMTLEFYSAGDSSNWAVSEWDTSFTRVRNIISGNNQILHQQYTSDKNQHIRLSFMTTPTTDDFHDIIPENLGKGWKIYYKDFHKEKNVLNGKKLTVMGDSLIYGNRLGPGATWIPNVAIKNDMTYVNLGDNGNPVATVANSGEVAMVDRISDIPEDTDYFVLLGGANDKRLNVPLGTIDSTDKTTFYGAINTIIPAVRNRCPKAKILFLTTYMRFQSPNSLNLGDGDYANAMIEACRRNLIPVFDNFHNTGVNFLNSDMIAWIDESRNVQKLVDNQTTYIADTHHFNVEGYIWLSPIYDNLIKNL